jgi:glycosyltransferase involved in cell wall biosynthesis
MLVNLAYCLQQPTGTTAYALNLLPYLRCLNPTYLATPASGLADYHPVPANMTAEFGRRGHLRRLLWTQFKLPKLYRRHNAGLLFSPIAEAPLGTHCRYVVTLHDLTPLRFPRDFSSLKWLYRYYVPQVLAQAEHIICNSEATASDVIEFYGVEPTKVTPILLAYDSAHFRPLNAEPQNYFLMLGRQAPYKNLTRAIAAFAELPPQLACELWIAGPADPRYTPTLVAQVDELGIQDRVKFLNYVPYSQLPQLLNQALALVFPSLWEGFGLPLIEAMACGTPVIAANVASLPEVAGNAAILIDPYNTDELAQAMKSIAADPALRQSLRDSGLARAQAFSWAKTGEATIDVLRRFL